MVTETCLFVPAVRNADGTLMLGRHMNAHLMFGVRFPAEDAAFGIRYAAGYAAPSPAGEA